MEHSTVMVVFMVGCTVHPPSFLAAQQHDETTLFVAKDTNESACHDGAATLFIPQLVLVGPGHLAIG
jgi:hypothetical protein